MSTQLDETVLKESKDAQVSLTSLSEESGVPLSFIKDELMLDGESVNIDDLRESMLKLVDSTFLKSVK